MVRQLLKAVLSPFVRGRRPAPTLGAVGDLYQPRYSPWLDPLGFGRLYESIRPFTVVDAPRCYVLHTLARQARHVAGEYWECGVYHGGTALLLAKVAAEDQRPLRLFDTFAGMPAPDPVRDWHAAGDFSDTSAARVRQLVDYERAVLHEGAIPASFQGLESQVIALAHIDVDLHRSVLDCCSFIYPRVAAGGFMVFDDYGWPTCVGARLAVDEFFADKPEVPLVLATGQALVIRLASPGSTRPTQGVL
jgi:O-methyltransferase